MLPRYDLFEFMSLKSGNTVPIRIFKKILQRNINEYW